MTALPDYVPIHPALLRKFEKTFAARPPECDLVDTAIAQIVESTRDYVEFVLATNGSAGADDGAIYVDETLLANNLKALEALLQSKYQIEVLYDSVKESRARIRQETRHEEPLTLALITGEGESEGAGGADVAAPPEGSADVATPPESSADVATSPESSARPNFDRTIERDHAANLALHASQNLLQTFVAAAPAHQYVKNVAFVLMHPQDPLPDERADDDVEVAGGKILLKDPVLLQYFQEPVQSRKCLHVLERQTIGSMFGVAPSIECPIAGCSAQIHKLDLQPDELMKLRVRVYMATHRREREQEET
jgi:hypothetical protein